MSAKDCKTLELMAVCLREGHENTGAFGNDTRKVVEKFVESPDRKSTKRFRDASKKVACEEQEPLQAKVQLSKKSGEKRSHSAGLKVEAGDREVGFEMRTNCFEL